MAEQDIEVKVEAAVDKEQVVELTDTIKELNENMDQLLGAEGAGAEVTKSIGVLLSLPDDEFNFLAPAFLDEYSRSLNNPNDQMMIAQAFNAAGARFEDFQDEISKLGEKFEQNTDLPKAKRDFLIQILGALCNAIGETQGIAKRFIRIPVEFCNDDAKMPEYAHKTDSGMDVFAVEDITIKPGETVIVPTGLKFAIPHGYELQVRPKSGRSAKSKLRISNTPGTIDAGYRDEVGIIIDNIAPVIKDAKMSEDGKLYDIVWGESYTIEKGEKVAQLVLQEVPKAVLYEVGSVLEVDSENRGGGFGSTGLK